MSSFREQWVVICRVRQWRYPPSPLLVWKIHITSNNKHLPCLNILHSGDGNGCTHSFRLCSSARSWREAPVTLMKMKSRSTLTTMLESIFMRLVSTDTKGRSLIDLQFVVCSARYKAVAPPSFRIRAANVGEWDVSLSLCRPEMDSGGFSSNDGSTECVIDYAGSPEEVFL